MIYNIKLNTSALNMKFNNIHIQNQLFYYISYYTESLLLEMRLLLYYIIYCT